MPVEYQFTITISISADEARKNAIRDWLAKELETRRNSGAIKSAQITITEVTVPETITLSPL